MSSKGKKKAKQSFWSRLNAKGKMYFVLAICCAIVFVTSLAAFLIVHALSTPATDPADSQTSDSMVDEQGYNKDQNTIDTAQYTSTILEESEDAGQDYVDETLFLGDSNTVRMRLLNYCTYDNAIGSVGMSARSLATYECVKFQGISGYKTMPEAVAIMQPRRVIITFGTNDLSPSNSTENFIESYEKGIKAVQEAYPSVDIIINSIPPLGKQHSNDSLTQTQVDEYNKGIVEMCKENGWKFLNSAEVLKDSSTGYAKSGYVVSDGIHLTSDAMDALFEYIRTHSYITEDDRPTLTSVPKHIEDKDVSSNSAATDVTTTTPSSSSSSEETTQATETPTEQPTAAPTAEPTPVPTPDPTPTPTPDPTPTPTPTPSSDPTPAPDTGEPPADSTVTENTVPENAVQENTEAVQQ